MSMPRVNFDETSNHAETIGGNECTLAEIGQALGISRSNAQRIEKEALAKLRANLAGLGLSFEDLAR